MPSRRAGGRRGQRVAAVAAPVSFALGPEDWPTLGLAVVIAAIAGVLYALTAARDIVLGDSAELVTTAITLGVAHPSGYPLLTLLGHAMTSLPLGTLAARVNLLSSLCGAITAGLVFLTARRLTGQRTAAAAAALLVATHPLVWEWSLVAETFPLNATLAAAVMYTLVRWDQSPEETRWLVAAAAGGFGAANHLTIGCLVPAAIIAMWRHREVLRTRPAVMLWCASGIVTGLLLYLYIPWAAAREPYLNWGHVSSASQLWSHIVRADYGSLSLTATPGASDASGISSRLALFFGSFTWIEAVLVAIGVMVAARRATTYCVMTVIAAALAGPAFAAAANLNVTLLGFAWVLQRFFVLPHVLVAPMAAFGIDAISGALSRALAPQRRPRLVTGVATAALLWIAGVAAPRFRTLDARDSHLARTFGEDVLATLDPDTVLLASGDEVIGPIAYLQAVEHQRPDVTFLMLGHLSRSEWYLDELRARDPRLVIPFRRYDATNPSTAIAALVDANPSRPFAIIGPPPDKSLERTHWYRPRGLVLQIEPMSKDVTVAAIADENDRLLRRYHVPPAAIGRHANFDPYILRDYATPARLVGFQFMAANLRPQAAAWFKRALEIDPEFAEARTDLARAGAPGR